MFKFTQNRRLSNFFVEFLLSTFLSLSVFLSGCNIQPKDNQNEWDDLVGYWKEYIVNDGIKNETAIRKIVINSKGKLEQSIVYELAPQCRIWLHDDDISFENGLLRFWGNDFEGYISSDKKSIPMNYKNMDSPFLLERLGDRDTIQLLDSIENCQNYEYVYGIPEKKDDQLLCADLESEGLDRDKLSDLINQIKKGKYDDIHSLLIVRNGKLLLEEYFWANGKISGPYINKVFRERLQNQASVTKSVNSALVSLAIKQGFILDTKFPVKEFFPEHTDIFTGGKERIQLYDLLTMSAGLQWNELEISYNNTGNDVNKMERSDDLIKYCLNKPLESKPGLVFNYSSGISLMLGEIVHRATGIETDKFAEINLFKQLGILDYSWNRRKNNLLATGGGLALRARDMAKFGLLYLNNGNWNGKQILPESYVQRSTQAQIKTRSGWYGFQWWIRSFNMGNREILAYYANGRAGQFIFVFPEIKMIIVSTAQNYEGGYHQEFYKMLHKEILPAVNF